MFSLLLGNEQLKSSFAAALREGQLPHGVLLCGEDGTGRGFAARLLAAAYLAPEDKQVQNAVLGDRYPECIVLQGEGAAGLIKIDAVRAMRARVQETSFYENGTVVIIEDAHNMAKPAANALLKVLEEPAPGVQFILTARSVAGVLPTILSRCGVYTLSPPSEAECLAYLKKNLPKEADISLLYRVFGGRLGLCKQYGENKVSFAKLERALQSAALLAQQNTYGLLCILASMEKQKPAVLEHLALLRFVLFSALLQKDGTSEMSRITQQIAAIGATERALSQNANLKLALSAFAVQCSMAIAQK